MSAALRLPLVALFAVGLTLAPPARADHLDDAKAAFVAGRVAFERGDYEVALGQFLVADRLAPAPNLTYNIGRTYEKLGRHREAVETFERFLQLSGPPHSDEERRVQDEVRGRIEADRRLAERRAPAPPAPTGVTAAPPPPSAATYAPAPVAAPAPVPPAPLTPAPLTPAQRLAKARAHRTGGVVVTTIGGVLALTGIVLTVDAFVNDHGTYASTPIAQDGNIIEAAVGFTLLAAGGTMAGVGGAVWARAQRQVVELSRPEPVPPAAPATGPAVGGPAQSFLFHAPTVTF